MTTQAGRHITNTVFSVMLGMVCLLNIVVVLADELQSGVPTTGIVSPLLFTTGDYIEVPSGAERLELSLEGDAVTQPDVDLYLKFGRAVEGSTISAIDADADFVSDSAGHLESLTVTPSSQPPLQAGRWFVSVLNLANFDAFTTLTATVIGGDISSSDDLFEMDGGLWWDPARSGTGIDFQVSGDGLFAIWYTYDNDGNPTWYLASGVNQGHRWEGILDRYQRDPVTDVVSNQPAGSMTVTFLDHQNAILEWKLDNLRGRQRLERFVFSNDLPHFNYTGTWYEPTAPGYGLTVDTQGDFVAAVLYFYDAAGKPRWALGSTNTTNPDDLPVTIPMAVYTQGFCLGCQATQPTANPAGTVTIDFKSLIRGTLNTALTLPGSLQGDWNLSDRSLIMLSNSTPITAGDIISRYGKPTLFFVECLNHAPTPGTERWDPVPSPGKVRYSTWLYNQSDSQSRVFALVNQESVESRVIATDFDLAEYPNPDIDPRRIGCSEDRSIVDTLVPDRDKRYTSKGTDQEADLLLSPGNQLSMDMFAISNQTLLQVMYMNGKMVGVSTQ